MKSLKKYALPFFVVFSSGLGFSSPSFAQYNPRYDNVTPETRDILETGDQMTRDLYRFNQIVERQNQLQYPCSEGDQRACAEIQQLNQEIERMTQRLNQM